MGSRAIGPSSSSSMLSLVVLAALLLLATAAFAGAPSPQAAPEATDETPPPAPSTAPAEGLHGVDVSHFSGTVDWQRVREAGYAFAYVKATEGVDSPDPLFTAHWSGLLGSGLARGAYHFYVTEDDPEEQARFFLDTVPHAPGDLVPVVDVEVVGRGTEDDWPQDLVRFMEIVEAELGARPILYTSPNFWDRHLADHPAAPELARSPLWLAQYGVEEPRLPAAWTSWLAWQWRGDARVDGVEKDVDLSRLRADIESLDVLRLPAEAISE